MRRDYEELCIKQAEIIEEQSKLLKELLYELMQYREMDSYEKKTNNLYKALDDI